MPFTRFLLFSSKLSLAYQLCLKAFLPGLWGQYLCLQTLHCLSIQSVPCDLPCAVETPMILGCTVVSLHDVTPRGCLWYHSWPLLLCHPSMLAWIHGVLNVELVWDALGLSLNLVRDSSTSALWQMEQTLLENPTATKPTVLSEPVLQLLSDFPDLWPLSAKACHKFYVLTSTLCFWLERELGCLKITK